MKGIKKAFFVIYVTKNLVNGKQYLGQHCTYDLEDNYLGSNETLKDDIRKLGNKNFSRRIIEHCTDIYHLAQRELYWIKEFDAVESPNWYNESYVCSPNVFFLKTHSAEARKKISLSRKGRKFPNHKKVNTPYPKMAHRKGVKLSEEHKLKISIGNSGANNAFFGKKHTLEARQKMSKTRKGRPLTSNHSKNISLGLKKLHRKAPLKRCEICNKEIPVNIYARFHGVNCKKNLIS